MGTGSVSGPSAGVRVVEVASHVFAPVAGAVLAEWGATLPLETAPEQFDERPAAPTRAPEHGENTESVLLELGLSWADITDLKERGAIL
jgi:crotonobetainyl-CoA:carnitine CoA-transferase CaiB-like acyl-CoA transferase